MSGYSAVPAGADPFPRPGGLHITPNIILTANKSSAVDAVTPNTNIHLQHLLAFTQLKVFLTTPGTTSFSRGSRHTGMGVKQEQVSDYFSDWDRPPSSLRTASHDPGTRFICSQGLLRVPNAPANPARSPGKPVCPLPALGHLPRAGWEGSTCHRDDVPRVTVSFLIHTLRTQLSPHYHPGGSKGLPAPHREGLSRKRVLLGHLFFQPGENPLPGGEVRWASLGPHRVRGVLAPPGAEMGNSGSHRAMDQN